MIGYLVQSERCGLVKYGPLCYCFQASVDITEEEVESKSQKIGGEPRFCEIRSSEYDIGIVITNPQEHIVWLMAQDWSHQHSITDGKGDDGTPVLLEELLTVNRFRFNHW